MGILKEPAKFIGKLGLPRGFSVCELGDQWVTHGKPHRLAKEWYQELGCGRYVSIDGNGRGDVTFDLNLPMSKAMLKDVGRFDLVTDFGTGEHIFDQAQVWRTLHQLSKPGGYIAFDRPTHGYPGHGFYRVEVGLLHDIAVANTYEVLRLECGHTVRGELIRGVFRRPDTDHPFVIPQQGRYKKILEIVC